MKRLLSCIVGPLAAMMLTVPGVTAGAASYIGPGDLVSSPDGALLYVLGQDAGQILVVDAASAQVVRKFECACPAAWRSVPTAKSCT